MASVDDAAAPLKYQTLVLKVSIHCEGCKRKVKKVLQGIEGVYKTTVDSQQQKVTVTGNVGADTLVKKLLKFGKHAEVLPEKKPAAENTPAGGGKKSKKKGGGSATKPEDIEKPEAGSEEEDSSAGGDAKQGGNEAKKPNDKESSTAPPPPEKTDGDDKDKTLTAVGDKKKEKKQQPVAAPGSISDSKQPNHLPPQAYHLPVYPTQPPAYVLSFNTSTPAGSHGAAAFYPALVQSNYLYSGHNPATATCYIPAMASVPGSCDFFSEENSNYCTVM
ncbi:hypothetical protein HPP92_010402 [Vanilla planifolia]|uniref:HMA domain-containing protein n=1 Tax=Vanilla planifolia TaxID=51239 RepID=A0A835QZ39_VANPL|nr:hypothetical protein HPP92_010694 [Vanilla planifolia]KAG0482318.1 hypothetical protein HPP92_010402 [Vanilla planifolia]